MSLFGLGRNFVKHADMGFIGVCHFPNPAENALNRIIKEEAETAQASGRCLTILATKKPKRKKCDYRRKKQRAAKRARGEKVSKR